MGTIATVISIIITFLDFFIPGYRKKRENIRNNYKTIWKKSTKLNPRDFFDYGNYKINDFYHMRPYLDEHIKEAIKCNKNCLIIGPPLSGKTRTIYQNIKELQKSVDVIIPFKKDVDFYYELIPRHFCFWRKRILILDDFDIYAKKKDFGVLVDFFIKEGIIIIGSCGSSKVLEELKGLMNIDSIFGNNIIEIIPLENQEANQISRENLGLKYLPDSFDGTIGSLILPLEEMNNRYSNLKTVEKTILNSIKLLKLFGIYDENGIFHLDNIKSLCKIEGIDIANYKWKESVKILEENEFLKKVNSEKIWANPAYIDKFVNIDKWSSLLDIANQFLVAFRNIPDILARCGENTFKYGLTSNDKMRFFNISIKAYKRALNFYNLENYPTEFANINDDLGSIYSQIFCLNKDKSYCFKTIKHIEQALKVRTKKNFPSFYSRLQNNIGMAYSNLFAHGDDNKKKEYFDKSLESYNLALGIRKRNSYLIEYANTQRNLGDLFYNYGCQFGDEKDYKTACSHYENALEIKTISKFPEEYGRLNISLGRSYGGIAHTSKSNVEDNYHKEIKCLEEALKIFSMEMPSEYSDINYSLGRTYASLVTVEGSEIYFRKGVEHFEKSLTTINIDENPELYCEIKNDIGVLYRIYAEFENSEDYCIKAIDYHKETLSIILEKRGSRLIHSQILFDLGTSYYTCSRFTKEREDKISFLKNSISSLKDSLISRTIDIFPCDFAYTSNNLGNAYELLAEIENIKYNCLKSLKQYRNALRVFNINNFSLDYARTQDNIGMAYYFFGKSMNSKKKLKFAINHFNKTLMIRTKEDLPFYYGVTSSHLADTLFELSKIENQKENLKEALKSNKIAYKIFKRTKNKDATEEVKENIRSIRKILKRK